MKRGQYIRTKDIRTKNSESVSGSNHWCFGIHLSQKTREKIGLKNKGRKRLDMIGDKNPMRQDEAKRKVKESKMGLKNPNYKGGISTENMKIRSSSELRLWKRLCMERDHFTCKKTGQKGGVLEVHHINNFARCIELRTVLDNGVTLSKKTHKEFHKRYGKKNNTREQLLEFLNIK